MKKNGMASFNHLKTTDKSTEDLWLHKQKHPYFHTILCKPLNVADRKSNLAKYQHKFLKLIPYLSDTQKSYR